MTAWRPNDLPAHFAPGALAAAPASHAAAARWAVGGDADATPGSNGGSDTRPGGAGPSGTDDADGHDRSGYSE
jgi:hypothetical protein